MREQLDARMPFPTLKAACGPVGRTIVDYYHLHVDRHFENAAQQLIDGRRLVVDGHNDREKRFVTTSLREMLDEGLRVRIANLRTARTVRSTRASHRRSPS